MGHSIAIEDSVAGLNAATAAGIKCVVCPDNFVPVLTTDYNGAALVIDSLEGLLPSKLEGITNENPGTY